MARINQFRDERNWRPHYNERDLALSICLEAAESLELFQWRTAGEGIKQEGRIKGELADVLIYSYMMVDNLGFGLDEIIEEKLKKNVLKYPVPHQEARILITRPKVQKNIGLGRIKIDAFLVSTSRVLSDLIYCLE